MGPLEEVKGSEGKGREGRAEGGVECLVVVVVVVPSMDNNSVLVSSFSSISILSSPLLHSLSSSYRFSALIPNHRFCYLESILQKR